MTFVAKLANRSYCDLLALLVLSAYVHSLAATFDLLILTAPFVFI